MYKRQRPDYVIHHSGYTKNYQSDQYDLELARSINLKPLDSLFKSLSSISCQGVILTGSSMEYPSLEQTFNESCKLRPNSKYGLSKLEATEKAFELAGKYEIPLNVARIFNPVGRLDKKEKLFPYIVSQVSKGLNVDLSSCEQVRNFHHVDFVTSSYEVLLDNFDGRQIYNICHRETRPLKEIILTLVAKLGFSLDHLKFGVKPMRQGESKYFNGSSEKLEEVYRHGLDLDTNISRMAFDLEEDLKNE